MAEGEVYFKAYLAAQSGAGDVAAAEEGKCDTHGFTELILASGQGLQLVLAKAAGIANCAVEFRAECEARGEVVLPGDVRRCRHGRVWFVRR